MGFVSGYRTPKSPSTLFVWQVVVSEHARGRGLATKMLSAIVDRACNSDITFIETTITADNAASRALFAKFATARNTSLVETVAFDKSIHFGNEHDTEFLIRIGPIRPHKNLN